MDLQRDTWDKVFDFFGGDVDKTITWHNVSNPLLGGLTPHELGEDHPERLHLFVTNSLSENERP